MSTIIPPHDKGNKSSLSLAPRLSNKINQLTACTRCNMTQKIKGTRVVPLCAAKKNSLGGYTVLRLNKSKQNRYIRPSCWNL